MIHRRIDDEYLDPKTFRPDSMLGVPGLVDVALAGNVTVGNAPGNRAADDKAVYVLVPDMIRYHLDGAPTLANVETYLLEDPDQLEQVLGRLDELVVKPVVASGGYGMLIGPSAGDQEMAEFSAKLRSDPRGYIAQQVVPLCRAPTLIGDRFEGHIDLRPFVVHGHPMRIAELLAQIDGVGYVARGAVNDAGNVARAKRIMVEAFTAQQQGSGLSSVEVLTMCPTGWFIPTEDAPASLEETIAGTHAVGVFRSALPRAQGAS